MKNWSEFRDSYVGLGLTIMLSMAMPFAAAAICYCLVYAVPFIWYLAPFVILFGIALALALSVAVGLIFKRMLWSLCVPVLTVVLVCCYM